MHCVWPLFGGVLYPLHMEVQCTCTASVAQLVELQPRMLEVVGSSPTQGSNFSLKGCCLGF